MIRYKHISEGPINMKSYKETDLIKYTTLKKWRNTANSSNVDKVLFNDETMELVIKFNTGDYYTYFDVDYNTFLLLIEPASKARTNGENEYGSWYIGKPSVGSGIEQLLSRFTYKKGGNLR